jgi:hypothetical protein
VVDAIGLDNNANYDLEARGELETIEAHISLWRAFLRIQENETIARRETAYSMQSKQLQIKKCD